MDLKIEDVAELLTVPQATIERWLDEGKIPAYKINEQFRFSRIEIEDWMMSRQLGIRTDGDSPFTEEEDAVFDPKKRQASGGIQQFIFYRALHKGTVLHNVPGKTKEEIIQKTTEAIAQKLQLDANVLAELLLDRESLQPTAFNHGIAVPHTRDFLLDAHHDVVVVVFPEEPIPYGALDGKPVHTLFFLFACEDKRHLNLLAKIAHLSHKPDALKFLEEKPSKEALLDYIRNWERTITQEDE